MKINKLLLSELSDILKEDFGIILDDIQLEDFATSLIVYFDVILQPEGGNKTI